MWYFFWVLGVMLACSLGVLNLLRLEAREVLAKEDVATDPLVQLLAKESILVTLRENINHSKHHKNPFSLIYLSLKPLKNQHKLTEHELNITLLKVTDFLKKDLRIELDIAVKVGNDAFLLAIPDTPEKKAETLAGRIKKNILANVETVTGIPVQIAIGVTEYSQQAHFPLIDEGEEQDEVDALLNTAIRKCFMTS